jgi:DNA-directed RNA polymerase alpha subunit
MSAPARRALDAAGIRCLDQLTQISEADIKQLHGIGPNSIKQLRRALTERGLSFAA